VGWRGAGSVIRGRRAALTGMHSTAKHMKDKIKEIDEQVCLSV